MTVLSEGSNRTVAEYAFPFQLERGDCRARRWRPPPLFPDRARRGLRSDAAILRRHILTLGAIWVLAAQAFGFAAGGHVTGRLIGPKLETKKEEEFRAGSHGLVMWAITVAAGLVLLALVAAGGAAIHRDGERSETSISAYWADMLLHPDSPHAMARGEDIAQDKLTAARILSADLHPGNTEHGANKSELTRLAALDGGLSYAEAGDRVNSIEGRMKAGVGHRAQGRRLWRAVARLRAAVRRGGGVAAAISAGWEEDKLNFSFARRT